MFKIIGADGKEYGPVTGDELRLWIREGRANAQSRVRREGETDWKTLGEFPEFEDVLGRKPENIPPVGAHSALPADVLQRDYHLDIAACISQGADVLKNNFALVFGAAAIYLLIQGAISGLGAIPFVGPLFSIASLFVLGQLLAGAYLVILKVIRRQPTEVGETFLGFKSAYVQLLLCYVVSALLTMLAAMPGLVMAAVPIVIMVANESANALLIAIAALGMVLALIPAIYLSVCWMFSLPLVIDKGLGFWQAMETSRKVVNKHWWMVFLLLIVGSIMNFVGMLLCCVGMFLSFPLFLAAMMHAYETLFSEREVAAA